MEDSDWIRQIVDNLLDHDLKLVYADWLEEHSDHRADFLRQYVRALESMDPAEFPASDEIPASWMELVGFHIVERAAALGCPSLRDILLRLARPALRMRLEFGEDRRLPVGSTKLGGIPDLPTTFPWPRGAECQAIFRESTSGVTRPAGFLGQINLEDLAQTQAGKALPKSGLLSFFCFQEVEKGRPDQIGVKVAFFPDTSDLTRTMPPSYLTKGNQMMRTQSVKFVEMLDIPDTTGPWQADLQPAEGEDNQGLNYEFRRRNFANMLGYGRGTSGGDPSPSKDHRHLIVLENSGECTLHLQIPVKQLAARNFNAVELVWVDFD